MQTKGPGKGQPFRVASLSNQITHFIPMTDVNSRLLNDRSVIEIFCDVMRGSTNQFDPSLPSTVIGLSTLKSRKERVMDIDHVGKALEEARAEHLHVLGKNNQFNPVFFEQTKDCELCLSLRGWCNRNSEEGHSKTLA